MNREAIDEAHGVRREGMMRRGPRLAGHVAGGTEVGGTHPGGTCAGGIEAREVGAGDTRPGGAEADERLQPRDWGIPDPPASPPWRPSRAERLLLVWVAVPFALFWLPLVRSLMDGPTYAWGVTWWRWSFGGAGLQGDLAWLAGGALLGVALLVSGWRGLGPFFRRVAPAWMTLLLARSLFHALGAEEPFLFRGDTLGIEVDLTWAGPAFHALGLALLLACLAVRHARGPAPCVPRWSATQARRLLALLALLPLQFVLLRFGEPHGVTDALGVILTLGQWFALGWALAPVSPPRFGPAASAGPRPAPHH
jgi:hypothetical protein